MHQSHQHHVEDQRTSPVRKPRQGDTYNGKKSRDHTDVDEHLKPDVGARTHKYECRELVLDLADKVQDPRKEQKIKEKQRHYAEKSEFLGIDRKNEVCVMLGNETEHILSAAFVTFAVKTAASYRDYRLFYVVLRSLAEFLRFFSQKHRYKRNYARFLIVVKSPHPEYRN